MDRVTVREINAAFFLEVLVYILEERGSSAGLLSTTRSLMFWQMLSHAEATQ